MLVKLFKTIVGISSFTYVKLFLTFFLIVSPNETFAQRKCEILYRSEGTKTVSQSVNMGAKLLHQKDPQLHISRSVEKAVATHKRTFKETLQKPAEKIDVWLKSLEKISNRAESSTNTLIQIKTMLQNQFVLKLEDIPQSYYDLQVKLARERGLGDIILVAEKKRQLADILINDQKKSLDYWIEYLVSKDTSMYPMWLKYWMFTGMTKLSKYHPQTGKFDNRDKGTVAPFADLNREALGLVADHVLQYLNKRSLDEIQDPELVKILPDLKFGKIYGHILFKLSISKQGVFKTNQGRWVIFKKGSDHMPLVKSLEGRNTGWCSAGESTAMLQLQKGDFHVYYSLDAYGEPVHPRVAIRMEGDDIAEVRGVAANQNLDPQINQSTVVSSKMKEFGSKSDKYQKRERDMKLLTQIETKQNAKISLEKEELKFLWELENTIEGFGYDKDPRIEQIRSQRDFKSDVIEVYGNKYTREEITTT
ncbi:MAG: hypothetical protein L6Q37_09500, partial [Bdellovibrionaceae bacterium]|nr:hypothetical protein [Pseudobdellovibrionaceae bacterium]